MTIYYLQQYFSIHNIFYIIFVFSLSEEEGETIDDALDIKPPQARMISQSRNKKRDERRSKRSERHRDEKHSRREKHHRDKSARTGKEREHYQREKERYYREKQHYEQISYVAHFEKGYRERKEESRVRRSDQRKHEEKKPGEMNESRYLKEQNVIVVRLYNTLCH